MLFKEKEYRLCLNCSRAVSAGEDEMICKRKGIVSKGSSCSAFQYDPLKREPPSLKRPDFTQHDAEEFQL